MKSRGTLYSKEKWRALYSRKDPLFSSTPNSILSFVVDMSKIKRWMTYQIANSYRTIIHHSHSTVPVLMLRHSSYTYFPAPSQSAYRRMMQRRASSALGKPSDPIRTVTSMNTWVPSSLTAMRSIPPILPVKGSSSPRAPGRS